MARFFLVVRICFLDGNCFAHTDRNFEVAAKRKQSMPTSSTNKVLSSPPG